MAWWGKVAVLGKRMNMTKVMVAMRDKEGSSRPPNLGTKRESLFKAPSPTAFLTMFFCETNKDQMHIWIGITGTGTHSAQG
jgi:hypothetical protein